MAKLSASGRSRVKTSDFALPGKAKGAKAKKKSGNYPIPDQNHARSALSLVSQHGTSAEKKQVRAAVHKKYPAIGAKGGSTIKKSTKPRGRPKAR